jgi:uncharacterized membrane-anchored protein
MVKRGEASMAHLRDAVAGLPRFPKYRLAWLVAAPLLILSLPVRSEVSPNEATSAAVAQAAPATAAPISGAAAVPAVTQAAVVVTPAEAKLPQSDDQQRRVLMLLLMNSAGPVRPYGNLGH